MVKADAGEVDEGVSLPREGSAEEPTDPGEGEQGNAKPVLAGMSDVGLESGGSKSVSVSFSDSDQGDNHHGHGEFGQQQGEREREWD